MGPQVAKPMVSTTVDSKGGGCRYVNGETHLKLLEPRKWSADADRGTQRVAGGGGDTLAEPWRMSRIWVREVDGSA